jgi:endonuclease III-like uncharacterized protein
MKELVGAILTQIIRSRLRAELLAIKGVGRETADSMICVSALKGTYPET